MRQFAVVAALTAGLILGGCALGVTAVKHLGPGACAPESCAPVVIEQAP